MSSSFTTDNIPKNFDHAEAQARIYQMWEDGGLFNADPGRGEPFTIVIPPPNVTGALHLGHALNNTLQDVLIRMKRMQGFNALWMPGTDHAGIATQAVVEKRIREEENLTRHDLGRENLVERIWQWKGEYEARILNQLKVMGCSCDWRRTRFTLDETCARAVRETFFDLFRKSLIYRGKRLVNWDTVLKTAVSDDELFHAKKPGYFWHFRYPIMDPKPGEPTHVTIATTRPETMLGDTAVAVHPDPAAALSRVEKDVSEKLRKAAAKEKEGYQQQLENVRERRDSMLPALEQLRDMAADGRKLMLPLMDREIPLIADEWAKPELGSGCVKITPAHDPNDYEVGLRQELPMINILRRDGTLNAITNQYEGLSIAEARQRVVADLEADGLLLEVEDREIDLAHSDRSKSAIEPFLADQWFVKMDQLAQSAMDAVEDERVKIFPARYRKGYLDWLAEKRDWPVSRQLWWGHQIPIWSRECETAAENDEMVRFLELQPETTNGDAAYNVELRAERDASLRLMDEESNSESPTAYSTIQLCLRPDDDELEAKYVDRGFEREEDVLDTWFSSALWPHSTLGWPEDSESLRYFYPTQTLITSRDIITLWVARMVLAGLNNMGEVPFREVFIHPKILDGYGETMSKSKGNGVDPLSVVRKFGADALRFGLAYLTTQTQDVRMPVQFECPHCGILMDQTIQNRERPRIECTKCKKPFRTQWARSDEDLQLTEAAVVSERFEIARNFCNKLWNASRFVLLNLSDFESGSVVDDDLAFEDRWLLSRLASVTESVTADINVYHYAEAARTLYDFAWDEFCSFYVEMTKARLQEESSKAVAQRVIAHSLDVLLRLLHPMAPFITEEVWSLLGNVAPRRGLSEPVAASESIMAASWPEVHSEHRNAEIETQFKIFQSVLGGLREIRSSQNIAPKTAIEFYVRCDEVTRHLLEPMKPYFQSMAKATCMAWGDAVVAPETHSAFRSDAIEVFVDLKDLIDVEAEIERNQRQADRLAGQINGKKKKLGNENFVSRAPENIVQKERDSLAELEQELLSVEKTLADLRARTS